MRHLAVAGVAFRALGDRPRLSAPIHLVLRRAGATATAVRFAAAIARLSADPHVPMA